VGVVGVLFRLMPRGVETDMKKMAEGVRGSIPNGIMIRGMQVQDIAYGLKSLLVSVQMSDVGGLLPATEEALAKVPGVESVEVMEESLL
jgi:elongation factor 1-beta